MKSLPQTHNNATLRKTNNAKKYPTHNQIKETNRVINKEKYNY